jgi:CRISPR system Cascade subunit CasD
LQAWGERARWTVRDTAPEPTKSGIVGLLACALGWSSDDALRTLSRQLRCGVRCDRSGSILRDYHTVSGGVMSAEGKVKINQSTKEPETVVSERRYLCDASFLIVLQGEPALIAQLADAIQDPHWTIFLGRKACVPSRPVFEAVGDFDTLEAALASRSVSANASAIEIDDAGVSLRAVVETNVGQGSMRRDQFDVLSRRTYLPRYVREITIRVEHHNTTNLIPKEI